MPIVPHIAKGRTSALLCQGTLCLLPMLGKVERAEQAGTGVNTKPSVLKTGYSLHKYFGWSVLDQKGMFLAVHNSSIGDLVTD